MKVGVLTGGGDAPGLNAAIRAVVLSALSRGDEVVGFLDGWKGVQDNLTIPLDREWVQDIHEVGGTNLGTSRTNPMKSEDTMKAVENHFRENGLDVLIAIGGDDTLSVAAELDRRGFPVVGVPKTMDNDVPETDYCIGFDTAVNRLMESIDRLRTTSRSHHRVMVVEAMGRDAGWVAGFGGLAGGADVILVPEIEVDLDDVAQRLEKVRSRGRSYAIVVAAEGISFGEAQVPENAKTDAFGHVILAEKAVGERLAQEIESRLGWETRSIQIGHLHRGGSPTAFDRILGTRYGEKAVELAHNNSFGQMVVLHGLDLTTVPLAQIAGKTKTLYPQFIELIQNLNA
ncbi:6-phosphofructokinase [Thermobaculum terrenum ATCC BAA-798]|uniref:Pyrophosphate--fructose 6-phosphate 1-phosphotransferase n=1 Tax=Thermobaculum terrenum (strain ATCC BAA-798 / CCMEE 7001 / YNP1) TaxID=525904 RepID=D1CD35_THET1|nr:ATP-dependent 6-phosphofructokinase [Thermobaculum terrenum]ACZ42700.1 6-phosphofructokinase [Thermobaculum terrenum ATCC BAA-798]